MDYNAYKIARDKAWQVLIENKVKELPIDLIKIAKYYGLTIQFFNDNIREAFIEDNTITINKNLIKTRARFTLAHELGHILLNHKDLAHAKHNEEDTNNIEEYQANIFARCLLMPAIVLKELNCIETNDIMELCNVSRQSAEYRSNRMKELLNRNKFNLSGLERQVYENFKVFISKH